MKKRTLTAVVVSVLLMVSLIGLTGCGEKNPGADMSLEQIMTEIVDGNTGEINIGSIEINNENFSSYLFIDPIDGAEALASEAMIGSIAHSVVLLRVPDGTDAADVASQIKTNANPAKWICVEAEKTEVVQNGNLILLVMSFADMTDDIVASFNDFCARNA